MPPRKQSQTVEIEMDEVETRPAAPRVFEHDETEIDPEADDFDAILASVGDDATQLTVRLYRELKGGKSEYLAKYTPKEWLATDLDGVQATFGPGDYRIRIYDQRSKVRKHKTFSIGAATLETLASRIQAQPAIDPNQLAQQITQSIAGAFAPLFQMMQQQQRAPSRQEMLQELVVMKQIFGGESQPRTDQLDLIQKVMGITREISPREGETGPYDVFLELTKAFAPVLMQGAKAGAMPAVAPAAAGTPGRPITPGPVPPGAPAGAPPADAPEPAHATDTGELDMKLKMAVMYLCEQAKRDADPALYAELVLDNLGEDGAQAMLTMPEDQLLSTLAAHDSRVMQYAEWFRTLRGIMGEILTEESAEDTNAEISAPTVNGSAPPNETAH